ncbi:hypothetical protein OS493_040180, partial [Desmophyllum pertusum]
MVMVALSQEACSGLRTTERIQGSRGLQRGFEAKTRSMRKAKLKELERSCQLRTRAMREAERRPSEELPFRLDAGFDFLTTSILQ